MSIMKEINEYYLGLDMGEGSLGWAVTTPDYHVVKKAGKALWGVRLFESAKTAKERRVFRTGRRRIERRNRRIDFLQELFSEAVCEKDPGFYQRLNDSRLWEEDKTERQINSLFNDVDFTDKSYHKKFPTIYHLRQKLMEDSCEFDVRLVYLAIHHILKHRGHFLLENFEIREDGAVGFEEAMADLGNVLGQFLDRSLPVENNDACKEILKNRKLNKLEKLEQLGKLYDAGGDKSIKEIFRLIVGGTAHLAVIFCDETLKNTERGKISFEDAQYEEYKNDVQTILDDRFDVVAACETLHNWAILAELMGNYKYISDAKVAIFNEHRKDLTVLKRLLKRDSNVYTKMFRMAGKNSYSAYVGLCKIHGKKVPIEKACTQGDFAGEIKKIIKNFPDSEDKKYILDKIERNELLPKAVSKQNGVIPYQLHLVELNKILSNAERYLPFLKKEDEYGTVSDKIRKLFTFRIPYYVGPLNGHSPFAWAVRKDENGHIYPWNFERKIDIEASAEEFIRRMTNKCTYLVKKDVLPKNSLLYTEFMVLNELNNVRIGSAQEKLPPGMKARVWERLFLKDKKITAKKMCSYLIREEHISKEEAAQISGIERDFKASLAPWIDMRKILGDNFTVSDSEKIIKDITLFGADKKMLRRRLKARFGYLEDCQVKELVRLPYQGWGRLSKEFLTQILPKAERDSTVLVDQETGEVMNIITALKKTDHNLMELLSGKFGYSAASSEVNTTSVSVCDKAISYKNIQDMHISPAVKRPLWQTLRVIKEIIHIMGKAPSRIFIEMARAEDEKKWKTVSRKDRLLDLYKKCKDEIRNWSADIKKLGEEIKELSDGQLRSDKLYLYYTQMGRSMYTGRPICLGSLMAGADYDIDHIYPRSATGDDSLDNRVLVERTENAKKGDHYPLSIEIQGGRAVFWKVLLDKGFISKEKYRRLTRKTLLTDDEKAGFIGRQLVETRQSTKAIAEILKKAFPETKIIYTKARNVSRFRQYAEFVKVRDMNDYHHAKDAYLNIVVGNAFYTKFTSNPIHFLSEKNAVYSLNERTFYQFPIQRGSTMAWEPGDSGTMAVVRKWMDKNNILYTRMPFEEKGGLFDQNILKKGKGQVSLRACGALSDIQKYGGYNNATASYFMLVKAEKNGKTIYLLETVPLHLSGRLESIEDKINFCRELWHRDRKDYKNPVICIPKIYKQSLFEVDGFREHISAKTGNQFVMRNAEQLCLNAESAQIIKNVLKFNQRKQVQKELKITVHDKITEENLINIFETFISKIQTSIYRNKFEASVGLMIKGKGTFIELSMEDKCKCIGEILHLFQCNPVLSDLQLIGGKKASGRIYMGKRFDGNKKVFLVLQSVTGFFEKKILLAPYEKK